MLWLDPRARACGASRARVEEPGVIVSSKEIAISVRGVSKMHPGIITEALGLVTRWGIRDRFRKLKR